MMKMMTIMKMMMMMRMRMRMMMMKLIEGALPQEELNNLNMKAPI